MNEKSKIRDVLQSHLNCNEDNYFDYVLFLLREKRKYVNAFIQSRKFPPFEIEIQVSSKCNLECKWCIGEVMQSNRQVQNLPNNIKKSNIDNIVDGIIDFDIDGMGVEFVKFSGYIGEPLLKKDETIKAIRTLVGAGKKVGLFTNGFFMNPDTWGTLVNIDYVHVSLDAGPKTFHWLKDSPKLPFGYDSFNKVISNIEGLVKKRNSSSSSNLKINIGYVVVPGNHEEIFETSKIVKSVGADSIRFKCDIEGKHDLVKCNILDEVFDQIDKARNELHEEGVFSVFSVHSKEDIKDRNYARWRCEYGCEFQNFFATIGSDGNLYLCDHNTMPNAISLGNAIDDPINKIWESNRRDYISNGIEFMCQSNVCPPFANKVNFFLSDLKDMVDKYGSDRVMGVIDEIVNA